MHPKRPDVLGTMPLIGLIERTAAKVVDAYLEPGLITVGTAVNVTHSAPVPMWMEVACRVRIVEIDGRKIVFDVEILDEEGIMSYPSLLKLFSVDREGFGECGRYDGI